MWTLSSARVRPALHRGGEEHAPTIPPLPPAVRKLEDKHKQRLLVSFDGSGDNADRDIDLLTQDITRTFKSAEMKLQRISGVDSDTSDAERNVRANIQRFVPGSRAPRRRAAAADPPWTARHCRRIAQSLQQLSTAFRRSQKQYLERVKQQKEGAASMDLLGTGAAEERSPKDTGFTDDQMMELELMEQNVDEHDQEIQHIGARQRVLAFALGSAHAVGVHSPQRGPSRSWRGFSRSWPRWSSTRCVVAAAARCAGSDPRPFLPHWPNGCRAPSSTASTTTWSAPWIGRSRACSNWSRCAFPLSLPPSNCPVRPRSLRHSHVRPHTCLLAGRGEPKERARDQVHLFPHCPHCHYGHRAGDQEDVRQWA